MTQLNGSPLFMIRTRETLAHCFLLWCE